MTGTTDGTTDRAARREASAGPERASGHTAGDRPTAGEYVLGSLGAVLVVALLVFLGHQAVTVHRGGPDLTATVSGITRVGDGWEVAFEVVNDGGRAVEEVQVRGTLTTEDGTTTEATAVLARVPAASSRGGALLFPTDPRAGQLEIRPEGYAEP